VKQKLLALLASLKTRAKLKYQQFDKEKFVANLKQRYERLHPRRQYYVRYVIPFLFLWCFLGIIGLPIQGMLFTSLGFFYPLFMNTPGIERMLDHKRYRLSLIRGIWRLNYNLTKLYKNKNFKYKEEVNSSLFATIFCFCLSIISWDFYFLLAPLGSALYFLLRRQYLLKGT
jgi:hypothetical protein